MNTFLSFLVLTFAFEASAQVVRCKDLIGEGHQNLTSDGPLGAIEKSSDLPAFISSRNKRDILALAVESVRGHISSLGPGLIFQSDRVAMDIIQNALFDVNIFNFPGGRTVVYNRRNPERSVEVYFLSDYQEILDLLVKPNLRPHVESLLNVNLQIILLTARTNESTGLFEPKDFR